MIKVVLIGAGNVATHLFQAFLQINIIELMQVYNPSKNRLDSFAPYIETTTKISEIKKADVYIIAIKDDAIAHISNELQELEGLLVHTSGAIPMTALNNHKRFGVFYPLQTFTKEKSVDFSTVPLCLETHKKEDYLLLESLASSISNTVYAINSEQRKSLHVAAVFINNFVNHLYHQAQEICTDNNVPFEILHPLLLETAQKALIVAPKEVQTGPARRNDTEVIKHHLDLLPKEIQKNIYSLLTKSIQQTYGQ